jgi:hypothetical protein
MAHADLAHVLAYEARRKALLVALREQRALTIGQLHILVHEGPYADDLATITVRELLDPNLSKPVLAPSEHESVTAAIMRVFGDQPSTWLASSSLSATWACVVGLRRSCSRRSWLVVCSSARARRRRRDIDLPLNQTFVLESDRARKSDARP